jgi:hypothetical protein
MRIQLQKGVTKRGTGKTFKPGVVIEANDPRKGVTLMEFLAGLKQFQDAHVAAKNVPSYLLPYFYIAVKRTERWAASVRGGLGPQGGQVNTEPFGEKDPDELYRVDVDNLRGHQNLKERF